MPAASAGVAGSRSRQRSDAVNSYDGYGVTVTPRNPDIIYGGFGADLLDGGVGDDQLFGSEGADTLYGAAGRDDLWGEADDDLLGGGDGDDRLSGEAGRDTLFGDAGFDILWGDVGDDRLFGGTGDDELHGGDGLDVLHGQDGGDRLEAGRGNDTLTGDGPVSWTNGAAAARRLYLATLDRGPDDAGHQYWQARLDGGESVASAAAGFVASTEFQAKYGALSNTQFVNLLYANVLDRAPDAAGLNHWVSQLNGGVGRASVVAGFSESVEFRTSTDVRDHAGQVFRLYDSAFDRSADAAGLALWTSAQYGGQTLGWIAEQFIASAEFTATYGNVTALSNEQFVRLLYQNVLDRDAGGDEVGFWLNQMAAGMSRTTLIVQFSESAEHVNGTALALDDFMRSSLPEWQDTLVGGDGDDVLTGSRGSDRFEFDINDSGRDVVYGFEIFDSVVLAGFDYADAEEALLNFTQVGADAVLTKGDTVIVLHDTALAELRAVPATHWLIV